MCLSEEIIIYLFLAIGLLLLKLGLWSSAWRNSFLYKSQCTPYHCQFSKLWQDPKGFGVSFQALSFIKSSVRWKDAGRRGILKKRLLACWSRDNLHVSFSYSILLIIFNLWRSNLTSPFQKKKIKVFRNYVIRI